MQSFSTNTINAINKTLQMRLCAYNTRRSLTQTTITLFDNNNNNTNNNNNSNDDKITTNNNNNNNYTLYKHEHKRLNTYQQRRCITTGNTLKKRAPNGYDPDENPLSGNILEMAKQFQLKQKGMFIYDVVYVAC